MPGWVKKPALPMLVAAALFAALSLASRGPGSAWVVVRPVAAGSPITSADVRYETIPSTFSPTGHAVARIPLVPGMVIGPGLESSRRRSGGDELSVSVTTLSAQDLNPGQTVRLGAAQNGRIWLSPPVTVVDATGGGVGSLSGMLTVTGSSAAMLALVQHDGNPSGTWVVMTVGSSR
jgi:hypothetical protein